LHDASGDGKADRAPSANEASQEKIRSFTYKVVFKLVLLARTAKACAAGEGRESYGAGVVVVVVVAFLTMTLVATILPSSFS
jgi:hypothetical protein